MSAQKLENGLQEGDASIDGKHPQGGGARKPHVAAAQGAQGGEKDFHAPAGQATAQEIMDQIVNAGMMFMHMNLTFVLLMLKSIYRFFVFMRR